MNAAVLKKTQESLGKVIKKPPLTEKLLSKPPFRYLHDIFSEVIRTTGFMKGLYGDNEMKSDNVKEKDSKISFLQKAIDVVMLVSGEPLSAKPARIVAGHEPEKTNELLQAMARCCLNKLPSDEAVKRVLSGEKVDLKTKASTSRSQDKENREERERPLDKEEKRKISKHRGGGDNKDPEQPREQEGPQRDGDKEKKEDKEKEKEKEKERSHKPQRSEQDHSKERDKDKSRDRDRDKGRVRDRDKTKDRERERDKERGREKDKERERDKDKERERDKDKERERERDKDKDRGKEREKTRERESDKRRDKERERHKEGEDNNTTTRVPEPEPEERAGPAESRETAKPPAASDSPARLPRPASAKGQRRRPQVGDPDESDSDGEAEPQRAAPQENGEVDGSTVTAHTASSSSRRPARPGSARPAPPRLRRQQSHTDVSSTDRLSSAKPSAPVIMDGKKLSEEKEEEDDQFVVEEAAPPPADAQELDPGSQALDSEEKHGGLVKKIMETKKDYEASPSSSKPSEQSWVSAAAQLKEREAVSREMERLRAAVQTVCRSSLPLGKIMDYIQEDVDSMQAELLTWRTENQEHAQALLQEQRATDRAVEPLKAELSELEQLIKEQQDKICAVKSNILKNEEKIQKMVTGINFSSRT